jgi:3-hydroxybutyrate dehydrogenase
VVRGKPAIVTGSASGIGSAVATAPAARATSILANGFDEATAIASSFWFAYAASGRQSPPAAIGMIAQTTREFGGVDICLNNTGIQYTAPAIKARNLSAALFATRAVRARMLRRNWRPVGNISSTHSLAGSVHKAADVAAKPGVLRLTKVIALETAGRWRRDGAIGMRP